MIRLVMIQVMTLEFTVVVRKVAFFFWGGECTAFLGFGGLEKIAIEFVIVSSLQCHLAIL